MRKFFSEWILFLTITLGSASAIWAQDTVACNTLKYESQLAYHDGEELTYAANYTWGPIWTDVGEVILKVKRVVGDPIRYYVRGDARTYKFYDNFFKVRDIYEASFAVPSMQPIHFYRNINEGDYAMKNTYQFNWVENQVRVTIQKNNNPSHDTIIKVQPCTLDVLTFFYNSRNIDFSNVKPNQSFPVTIMIDDEVYTINYRFLKRETKKIKSIGKINCLKFSVGVVAGEVFKGDEKIDMWVSDDGNHIPVMLETPIIVGKVKGRLKGYKNLKYPLNMAK